MLIRPTIAKQEPVYMQIYCETMLRILNNCHKVGYGPENVNNAFKNG